MTQSQIIKEILTKFSELNGTKFVGIRRYEAKSSGEIANHVVNANFNYGNAVKKDLGKLNSLTSADIVSISKKCGIENEIIKEAVTALTTSFEKNGNDNTKSKQSEAQKNAYVKITNSVKLHIESRQLHIFALAVSKEILTKGEYKIVNSRPLTIAKNAVKRFCNFTTAKYRNFIIEPSLLSKVVISGKTISLV